MPVVQEMQEMCVATINMYFSILSNTAK